MPTLPIATTLYDLLTSVEATIAPIFPSSSSVWCGLNSDKVNFTIGPPVAVIVPGVQTNDLAKQWGIDRDNSGIGMALYLQGQFSVVVWNQLALDETSKADSFLNDPTYGTLQIVQSVINAIHMTQIFSSTSGGGLITAEPVRLLKYSKFTRVIDPPGWGYIEIQFEARWLSALV